MFIIYAETSTDTTKIIWALNHGITDKVATKYFKSISLTKSQITN